MINVFKLRKWGALAFCTLFSVICFFVGLIYYNFWIALLTLAGGMIAGFLVANLLLSNPFRQMLEGKGILAFNMDSTGILRPFIVAVQPPYIRGKINKEIVTDVFNRSTVFNLAPPLKANKKAKLKPDGGITINLNEKQYNAARFGFFHFPTLIYNSQIKSFITKDFLSNEEKDTFAEHGVLYMNRKMEELTSAVRDFGRHVVELTKPKKSIFANKWVLIVVIILAVLLIALFAPAIISAIKGFIGGSAGGGTLLGKAAGSAVTPR